MNERIEEVLKEQSNLVDSFESSKGLTRRRIDTAQIWVDKTNNIANVVVRKRLWRFGVLVNDSLQTISNDDSTVKGFTGFKKA